MDIEVLNQLRKATETGIQNVLNELEDQSIELKIDEFNGHKREDLIIKFDRFEYHLNETGNKENVRIRLGIYLIDENELWTHSLEPIGSYITVYDLNNKLIDEFIDIESKERWFGMNSWIEILNNATPKSYYQIDSQEYEFICYINNTISLFQGRNFKLISFFILKSLDYLESKKIQNCIYFNEAKEYLKYLFYYLKNNNLVDPVFIEKHKIEERVKTKS